MVVDIDEGSNLDDLFASVDELAVSPEKPVKTVLVVDDSKMMRLAVISIVTRAGHRTIEAGDGNEALGACARSSPDLIFLDWIMPVKNGLETLRELRAMPAMADTPIVLLTQVKDKDTIKEAGVYGVQDYLSKPARPERVLEKISKYLG